MDTNEFKYMMGGIFGNIVSFWGLTIEQADHIVSLLCGLIGILITIASTIIIPVWKKLHEAKKDGEITPDEADDILNTLKDGMDKLKDDHDDEDHDEGGKHE